MTWKSDYILNVTLHIAWWRHSIRYLRNVASVSVEKLIALKLFIVVIFQRQLSLPSVNAAFDHHQFPSLDLKCACRLKF